MKQLATTYQSNDNMQGISKFFASFSMNYLVNPNNLLTHTHLASKTSFFFSVYARVKCAVYPINKGLLGVSSVRISMSFCQASQRVINAILIDQKHKTKYIKNR